MNWDGSLLGLFCSRLIKMKSRFNPISSQFPSRRHERQRKPVYVPSCRVEISPFLRSISLGRRWSRKECSTKLEFKYFQVRPNPFLEPELAIGSLTNSLAGLESLYSSPDSQTNHFSWLKDKKLCTDAWAGALPIPLLSPEPLPSPEPHLLKVD